MKHYTKSDFKRTVIAAMNANFGCAPKMSDIVLHYTEEDRTKIVFSVKGIIYKFSSWVSSDGSIWCGNGTIEKDNIVQIITDALYPDYVKSGDELKNIIEDYKKTGVSGLIYTWNKFIGKWEFSMSF